MSYGHETGSTPFCAVGDREDPIVQISREWEEHEHEKHGGWTLTGDGDIDHLTGACWTKGDHIVIVIDTNYMTDEGEDLFLSESREALEQWLTDHGLKERPVHENVRIEQLT